jgi:pyruvate kinase
VLEALVGAGMDVARLNFSHGTHEEHRDVFERLRRIDGKVTVIQDLQGPKIRVGEIRGDGMTLGDGDSVVLTSRGPGGGDRTIPVSYQNLPQEVGPGDAIYLADGIIHLEVERVEGERVHCRVVHGGHITSNKGVNLPGVKIGVPALTGKDRRDLEFGLGLGVDYVALSFVRSAAEVLQLREIIAERRAPARVIAKIEKREALEELGAIIGAADAIMIARGDLGVEISLEEVPVFQKSIIDASLANGKPVITATQMLETMVVAERPTRAEASDVANAVIDGTDALMLSAETATGRYPIESVRIMDRIIRKAEEFRSGVSGRRNDAPVLAVRDGEAPDGEDAFTDAVCAGAVETARAVHATAIACLTHSGRTARLIARRRPDVPVIALTDFPPVIRQMNLVWGVGAIPIERIESTEKILRLVREKLSGAGCRGKIVITAGIPTKERKNTNTIHILSA